MSHNNNSSSGSNNDSASSSSEQSASRQLSLNELVFNRSFLAVPSKERRGKNWFDECFVSKVDEDEIWKNIKTSKRKLNKQEKIRVRV